MNEVFWGIWDTESLIWEDETVLWETKEKAQEELDRNRDWYGDSSQVVKVTITLE